MSVGSLQFAVNSFFDDNVFMLPTADLLLPTHDSTVQVCDARNDATKNCSPAHKKYFTTLCAFITFPS